MRSAHCFCALFSAALWLGGLSLTALAQDKPKPAEYDPTLPAKTELKSEIKNEPKTDPKAGTKTEPKADEKPAGPEKKVSDNKRAFLWRVTSGTATVYLFGTVHVGKQSFYPLPALVEEALDQSAKVVMEADISKSDGAAELDKMMFYTAPQSLDKNISKPLFDRLSTQLTRLNLPPQGAKNMKPWVVGGFLSVNEFVRLGYEMNYGVDSYLIDEARKRGKPILELETPVAQLKVLNDMPLRLQEIYLENAVYSLENGLYEKHINDLVDAWLAGDPAKLENIYTLMTKPLKNAADIDDILLYSRHDAMVKKIEQFLASKETHFVAVGSLHLIGPRGLVSLLKNRRHKVEQLGIAPTGVEKK
jgi:uncharacterized protein